MPKTRWRRVLLGIGALSIILLLVAFGPAQRYLLRLHVLDSPAPSPAAMWAVADAYDDPLALANDFWNTGHLPHRQFALDYLARTDATAYPAIRPFLIERLWDPDGVVASLALGRLIAAHDPANLPVFAQLLHEADPRLRWHAAWAISSQGDLRCAGWIMPLLDDPDLPARLIGMGALQRWTGNDDGVSSDSPAAAIADAAANWRTWWRASAAATPCFPPVELAVQRPRPLPPPFRLRDDAGRFNGLERWSGHPVVLVFWSELEPLSLTQLSILEGLGSLADATYVAVNVDHVPTIYPDHSEMASHGASTAYLPPVAWSHQVRLADLQAVQSLGIANTPVTVIIDREGRLCRRLDDVRTAAGMQAMILEAAAAP